MSLSTVQLPAEAALDLNDRIAQIRTRLSGRIKLGLYSAFTRYGLCRDLTRPLERPNAKIPIDVRPLQDSDLDALFSLDASANSLEEKLEVAWRRSFVEKGARGGFVAVDKRSETPCYVQWLFSPQQNDFIERLGGFPALKPGEALLENAYTPPKHRGLGIMAAAMAMIAERATDINARYVMTYVDDKNIASLKGCQRAGFFPELLHRRHRLGFGLITKDRFETLPDGDPRRTLKF